MEKSILNYCHWCILYVLNESTAKWKVTVCWGIDIENYYRYKYNVLKNNKDLYGIRYLKHKGKITDYIFKI